MHHLVRTTVTIAILLVGSARPVLGYDCRSSDEYKEHLRASSTVLAEVEDLRQNALQFLTDTRGLTYDGAIEAYGRLRDLPEDQGYRKTFEELMARVLDVEPSSFDECATLIQDQERLNDVFRNWARFRFGQISGQQALQPNNQRASFNALCWSWVDPPQSVTERVCDCIYRRVSEDGAIGVDQATRTPKSFWQGLPSSVPRNSIESALKKAFQKCF